MHEITINGKPLELERADVLDILVGLALLTERGQAIELRQKLVALGMPEYTIPKRITLPGAQHSYDVECIEDGVTRYITVEAVNRTQAGAAVRKLGLEVCSVNMVG